MTRRFLRSALFALTLLTGGCQFGRSARAPEARQAVAQSGPALPPTHLPNQVEAKSPPQPKPSGTEPKWPEFTKEKPFADVRPVALEKELPPPQPIVDIKPAPKHPVVSAMECMLDDRHEDALRYLQKYDPRTQEFLQRVLPTLSLVARNNHLGPSDIAALDTQLTSIKVYLQQLSDFSLPRMRFCESIKGYAVYKPLPADHEFIAASSDRPGELVQLYVELRNFASEPKGGLFETLLSSQLEIQDTKGRAVWSHRFRPEDLKIVSERSLGEYYRSFTFALPPNLPAGTYTLWVVMTDETHPASPRTARSSLPLRVAAPKD